MGNKNSIANSKDLKTLTEDECKKVPLFSLDGMDFNCRVTNVYDGDTCHVIIRHNDKLLRFKLRMEGYDSPEMRPPKNKENRGDIIISAKKAKDALIIKTRDKILKLKCGKWDKYGRLLGTLYDNKININQWMIKNDYGYEYYGGTKKTIN